MGAAPSICVQAQRSTHIRRYSVQAETTVRLCSCAHAPNPLHQSYQFSISKTSQLKIKTITFTQYEKHNAQQKY
jgi:hypothetical protein